MNSEQMIAILLSWTVHLSQYPYPATLPQVEYKPHTFFVEHACLGNEKCRAAAWYDNHGVVYIDERIKDQDDAMTRSLYVHEFTHYLQDLSGMYDPHNCDDHMRREREAYSIQRQYLNKIAGRFVAVYMDYPPCPG